MIYLDNAATTWPKPPRVREAVNRALQFYGANPGRGGYEMSMRSSQAVYECRALLADFLGARGPACVSFQPSCTQAVNVVLKGLLKPGDHVVYSDLEHNAVARPLKRLEAAGVSSAMVKTVPGDSVATMEAFRQAMRENTRLVVCTQASNVWGFRLPVERIAALCHQYGAEICVDAAQSAGLAPIDVENGGIDYLCCAGHKGLYGPMGTGVLVIRDPERAPESLIEGGTGTFSASAEQPRELPERLESGTPNLPGIIGLRAGVEFVKSRGAENLWKAELRWTAELHRRLSATPGLRLYTPEPQYPWSMPVLSFNVEGLAAEEVGERLARQGIAVRCGLHCAPLAHEKLGTGDCGTVRAAPSAFTRREELDRLTALLKKMGQGR